MNEISMSNIRNVSTCHPNYIITKMRGKFLHEK